MLVDELLGVGLGVTERVDELEMDGVSEAVLVVLWEGVAEADATLERLGVDEGESGRGEGRRVGARGVSRRLV